MSMGKLAKYGMVGGLAGIAAKKAGISVNDIARHGGFGLMGLALAKKRKRQNEAGMPVGGGMRRTFAEEAGIQPTAEPMMRKGGKVKKMAKGGSASKRGDGIAKKGHTKGRMV